MGKLAKFITLNIGLHIAGGEKPVILPEQARNILRLYGFDCTYNRIDIATHERGSESTLIVMVPYVGELRQFETYLHFVAVALQQDCIAYAFESHGELVGGLIGPKAVEWGEFNPEYFLPYDDAISLAA